MWEKRLYQTYCESFEKAAVTDVVAKLIVDRNHRQRRRFAVAIVLTAGILTFFQGIETAPSVLKTAAAPAQRHQSNCVEGTVVAEGKTRENRVVPAELFAQPAVYGFIRLIFPDLKLRLVDLQISEHIRSHNTFWFIIIPYVSEFFNSLSNYFSTKRRKAGTIPAGRGVFALAFPLGAPYNGMQKGWDDGKMVWRRIGVQRGSDRLPAWRPYRAVLP